jgi:hypothetical protein
VNQDLALRQAVEGQGFTASGRLEKRIEKVLINLEIVLVESEVALVRRSIFVSTYVITHADL